MCTVQGGYQQAQQGDATLMMGPQVAEAEEQSRNLSDLATR